MKNQSNKLQNKGHVAIFQCYWSVQVHTLNIVDLLLAAEWKVDLYLYNTGSRIGDLTELSKTRDHLTLHQLDGSAVMPVFADKWSLKGLLQRAEWHVKKAFYASDTSNVSYAVVEKTKSIFEQRHYHGMLAIEPLSMVWASRVRGRKNTPLVYYSLEVYTAQDGRMPEDAYKRQNKAEAVCFKKVDGLIIQDSARADILNEKYGVTNPPTSVYLPVSLKPYAKKEDVSYFLHDRLGLSHQTNIVLYLGILTSNRFCEDLIDVADSLPESYQLVIHTGSAPQTEYEHEVHEVALSKGIPVSTESLPIEQVPELFASSSIAVVLYTPDTPNNRLTGRASEKAAMAAQTGTPIIAMSSTSLGDVIEEYHNGVAIDDLKQFPAAVRAIDQDYVRYTKGSIKAYDEIYNFDAHQGKLVAFLDKVFCSRKYN